VVDDFSFHFSLRAVGLIIHQSSDVEGVLFVFHFNQFVLFDISREGESWNRHIFLKGKFKAQVQGLRLGRSVNITGISVHPLVQVRLIRIQDVVNSQKKRRVIVFGDVD
jgi:hypothetical protein